MQLLSRLGFVAMFTPSACAVGTVVDTDVPDARGVDARPMGLDALDSSPSDVGLVDAVTVDMAPCGASGVACCVGGVCAMGSVCRAGLCEVAVDCGNDGQPCCATDGGSTCAATLVCSMTRCAPPAMAMCGGAMQACCTGGACQAGFVCDAAQCVMCGSLGSQCCAGACLAGSVCAAGRGALDADGDGSPAGTDCNREPHCATWRARTLQRDRRRLQRDDRRRSGVRSVEPAAR